MTFRLALRGLRRSPGFTIAAILTLALGTGATAAVFVLINGVLLRPLPWADPDRVGIVWPVQPTGVRTWLSVPELEELQRDLSGVVRISGMTDLRPNLIVDGVGHEVQALAVSYEFFDMLGVEPFLGRKFSAEDDREGAAPVIVLSHTFWQTQFGASHAIVGRSVRLNERDYSVIGILPPAFTLLPASSVLPERVDVWLPLRLHVAARERTVRFLHALGRLQPGVTFTQANEAMRSYGERVAGQFPSAYSGGTWRFTIAPFKDDILKNTRTALLIVFGLVLLVLVIACTNVTNLLLARGEARRAELAVRAALGAGPGRLAGEVFVETVVLASAGGALGVALAAAVPRALRAIDASALPRLDQTGPDVGALWFGAGLILLTAGVLSSVPLLERLRLQRSGAALMNRTTGRTRRGARLGSALVVMQTALATTVLITTCFLTVTFVRLNRADLGFSTERLLTGRVTLSSKYAPGDDVTGFFRSAIGAIEQVGGVSGAAAITQVPLSGTMLGSTFLTGRAPDAHRIDADLRGITPGYFDVVGMPLVQGRTFTEQDSATTPGVAIVDEAFARRLNPDGAVVGRWIHWFRQPDVPLEIVGVVRAVRHRGPAEPPRETVYRPYRQYSRASMFLVVRTNVDPASATSAVRAAIRSIDPTQPIADIATMEMRLERSMTRARTSVLLSLSVAVLALALALVGLYGVLSFGVAQRLREFGVRMSLGATPASVRRLVLKQGLALTCLGVVIGIGASAAVAVLIRSALYETSVANPWQYIMGAGVVLLSSVGAFWLPARRASATDLVIALRSE